MPLRPRQHAFTLVELSIVLVVIGLIVGGLLLGRDLIENGERKQIMKEVDSIRMAVNAFRIKYNYYPGDMPNASTLFSPCIAWCNGNADGKIQPSTEMYAAWFFLGASGLYPGTYSGAYNFVGLTSYTWGLNAPPAKRGGGYAFTWPYSPNLMAEYTYSIHYTSAFNTSTGYDIPTVTPAFAREIDKKFDDGYPEQGRITATRGSDTTVTCRLSSIAYDITNSNVGCVMFFNY